MEHYGFLSLIPALSTVVLALATRRTFEALLGGSVIGYVILKGPGFFKAFLDSALAVMADPTIGWVILVCGLFGSLIALLTKAGGTQAFSGVVLRFAKSKKTALLTGWVLGLIIFIDDYLNALTVGTSMQRVTDEHKVSREMLAYIVDCTAAPVCILVPFSTWAIFVAGLLEGQGLVEAGQGISGFIRTIPYNLYGWTAAIIVPLVILGVIPPLGAMRKAEERAQRGVLAPPGSNNISIIGADFEVEQGVKPRLVNFVLPIVVLIVATWASGVDAFQGIVIAMVITAVLYIGSRVMSPLTFADTFFDGFKTMVYPLAIVMVSFILRNANDELGLTPYVIETVKPIMNPGLLPAVAFVTLALVAFATGTFWGLYAVSLPIIVPLAQAIGSNVWLAVGAVISAGAFGSHACFFADATVLSSAGSGCDNMAHALTQLPYVLIAGGISTVLYVILGYALI